MDLKFIKIFEFCNISYGGVMDTYKLKLILKYFKISKLVDRELFLFACFFG